jgi:hypothetical protein
MTDATAATTATDEAAFVPRGRPVARFVAGIAAVALVLGGLWWSAVFNPRLVLELEPFDARSTGEAVVRVENHGPTDAWVRAVDVDDPFVRLAAPAPATRVVAGTVARITVGYRVDCAAYDAAKRTSRGAPSPSLRLAFEVRALLGPGRRTHVSQGGGGDLATACGESPPPS